MKLGTHSLLWGGGTDLVKYTFYKQINASIILKENFKSLFLCTRCHEILSFLPKKRIFQEGNHASRWFITSRIALAFL